MTEKTGTIRLLRDGAIARIVIDRPSKLNAITPEMTKEFFDISDAINADDEVRVAIITGVGERAFCAGTDIKSLDSYPTPWAFRNRRDYSKAVWQIRKPVIAAINGLALGGGLEITLNSDIRLAARSARFGAGEIKLGWHAGDATQLLPRLIGHGDAMRILLTGTDFDAEEARRLGLVQEVCDPADLEERALSMARTIAENAPIAAQVTKHLVRIGAGASVEAGMALQADLQAVCLATQDAQEGILAFAEKRKPDFRGV